MGEVVCRAWESHEVVGLNVGGDSFVTTVETLTHRNESAYFSAMFSGHLGVRLDSGGRVFLDRDGKRFRHVLNFLRCGTVHIGENDVATMREVHEEAVFFGMPSLQTKLEGMVKQVEETKKAQDAEEDVRLFSRIMQLHVPSGHQFQHQQDSSSGFQGTNPNASPTKPILSQQSAFSEASEMDDGNQTSAAYNLVLDEDF
ncbi:BTB/POZ domain-containing protein KCTD21 [Porphyridium purpureum]|uniref:BTB/POZ domain-containing protein KCTD21 n=1 Tax=Porphyridium purpureum TaxID=35688 RepID=A0A5J4YIH2_PORPP|nr:BTB/POZ domain-containing protein KCTD21 [Porphyridium purpureum]|eukprot:POR3668..scf251_18